MDKIEMLHELCETLTKELEDVNSKIGQSGGMSAGDLEAIDKLTHSLKSVKATIAMMEQEGGYSTRYPMYYYEGNGSSNYGGGNSNRDGGSYRGGNSYRRGRDSMGRYTSRRGYSRDDFADRLREVMEEAPDEQTRQSIERMIQKMDRE